MAFETRPAGVMNDITLSLILRVVCGFVLVAAILPFVFHVRKDYLSFLALGPGGTPSTFTGYLRVKLLGLVALRNRYLPGPISSSQELTKGYLTSLPKRSRPRPDSRGIAPHRQINQKADPETFRGLTAAIEWMAAGNQHLAVGTSCFEKHGTGLFSTSPARKTCRGEIVHAHASDGSMHMTLHPADANVVLGAGWGERHPLAGVFFKRFLPEGFIMLYAPQDGREIEIALQVIKAASWFVSGGDVVDGQEQGSEWSHGWSSSKCEVNKFISLSAETS